MTSPSDSYLKSSTDPGKFSEGPLFLSARWKWLIMANYICDPELLTDWLPSGTELDSWNNNCILSLVGFQFHDTRVKGISFPLHRHFEEINLRFYVRRKEGKIVKRGVVFIREFVPKPLISFVANTFYGENYRTVPIRSSFFAREGFLNIGYEWKNRGLWNSLSVRAQPEAKEIVKNSEEDYVLEHYWGYVKRGNFVTTEYRVDHPRWLVHRVDDWKVKAEFSNLYGSAFSFLDNQKPCSVFLAGGSTVKVYKGKYIRT